MDINFLKKHLRLFCACVRFFDNALGRAIWVALPSALSKNTSIAPFVKYALFSEQMGYCALPNSYDIIKTYKKDTLYLTLTTYPKMYENRLR
jgi:hypothetical protein